MTLPHTLTIEVARSAAWLAILTLVFVPLERLFAERPQPVRRSQLAADLCYYVVNSLGTVSLLALLSGLIATLAQRVLPPLWLTWVDGVGLWPRVALTLAVSEFGTYWGHRWSHEMPLLWRFHAIHHSPTEIDWLTSSRGHPVDLVFTRLCGLTLVCVTGLAHLDTGAPNTTMLLATVFSIVWGYFIHANLCWRFGWLESVIATPAFHRWHHTNDAWRDHNYASTLPVYDRLFGTFHLPATDRPPVYGIDAKLPSGFWRQLIEPLGFSDAEKRAATPKSFPSIALDGGSGPS